MENAGAACRVAPSRFAWCAVHGVKIRSRIRLHLTTGRSIEGVLLARRGGVLELGDARIEIDGKLVRVDERVFVPKERVEFAQAGGAA